MKLLRATLVAGALFLGGCSAGTPVNATAMESAFNENLPGSSIKGMCDPAYTHWACFYEGVEADGSYLVVKLGVPGGMDEDALAQRAGKHWFNFIGKRYPDLSIIIVRINGIDYNVYR